MTHHEEQIELADGRTLEVATMGNPSGSTVFFHHGTPGSTRTVKSLEGLLDFGDFYVVTTSRPGYGQSSRHEGRSIASVVGDLHAALDARCRSAVTLASVAPADVDFDWTEGMGPENVEEYALAQEGGPAYEELMAATGDFLGLATKDTIVEMIGGLLSEPDRLAISNDDAREIFVEGMRYGFANGWRGYFDDNVAMMLPWGFDVSDIGVPVHLFYGDDDLMVPESHGRWLSAHVANSRVTHHPDEGHLSIFMNHLDAVASALKES